MSEIPVPIPRNQDDRWTRATYGSWGEFSTQGGRVLYLSAHVNLNGGQANGGNSLVESIAPVREILDTTKLSFAELLQRDLEDHRVLSGLIPYLMDDSQGSIGFFPPLLAVLLPFDSTTPASFNSAIEKYRRSENGIWTRDLVCPEYFRFSRTAFGENEDVVRSQRTAELEWNSDKAKLVIIDGQHRAMALLAIYRSLAPGDKWAGSGARYQHFYHEAINKRWGGNGLPNLEVPISICVFPDLLGPNKGEDVHRAARRLFVDVNKEAKTPNKSRLILLSETNLSDIFTRSMLDELRALNQTPEQPTVLPLSAIEYDTPSSHRPNSNDTRPQRKICVATVQQLKVVIEQVLRGSEEWVTNIQKIAKKQSPGSEGFMIKQLGLDDDDETKLIVNGKPILKLTELRRDAFPPEAVPTLRESFLVRWGRPLIHIFSALEPYKTTASAIRSFESNWGVSPDQEMALAKEALFEGVGTYWTLKEFHDEWKENHPLEKPAAASAWEIVDQKAHEYEDERTASIVGSKSLTQDEKMAAKSLADRASTQALMSGIAMSYATLCSDFKISADNRQTFAEEFVSRLNEFLCSTSESGRRRFFYFTDVQPEGDHSAAFYSFVKNLEPVRWVHMRWLVLEAFFSSPFEWSDTMLKLVPEEKLNAVKSERVQQLRKVLIDTVVEEHIRKDLPKDHTSSDRMAVTTRVIEALESRYLDWFGEVVSFSGPDQSDNAGKNLDLDVVDENEEDEEDLDAEVFDD